MPLPVATERQIYALLRDAGYEQTEQRTATGTFWRSTETGRHVQVPDSLKGCYPDWLLADLVDIIGKVDPWALSKMKPRH